MTHWMLWKHSSRNTMISRRHWRLRTTPSRYSCLFQISSSCITIILRLSFPHFQALDEGATKLVTASHYASADIDQRRKEVHVSCTHILWPHPLVHTSCGHTLLYTHPVATPSCTHILWPHPLVHTSCGHTLMYTPSCHPFLTPLS